MSCPLSKRGHRWKPLQIKIAAGKASILNGAKGWESSGDYDIKTIYALRVCECGAEGRVDNQGRVITLSNSA